ncbi:MAG: sigma-70 family RNA polymerase sigma factor, partial [Acidimicrobiales bacterium]|nr:sigma-70 family RNA polymerase sigma factor [Acidimicrobiales bacterium]
MATTSEDLAERSLLAAARDGDDDAIAVLFERHLDDARAVAVHVTRSPADADDVLAAAAEAVLAAIRRGNGPTEAFGPYLTTAVRRHAWRRTAEARHTTPGDVPDTPVDDASFDPIEADTVRRALAQLPPAQRDLLWLAEVEGCSPAELAADHGASPNTMAAAALRARRGLRRAYILAHLGPDAPDACRVALGRLAGSSRRNTSGADVARADAHADACAPCAEVLADLADLRRHRRGLLVLLPAAWQLRLLHRAAPQTADGSAPGPGHPASTAAPETTLVPGTVPGHRAAALVGAGAVAMVVLVAAVVTQLDRPEAASAGPTTSIAGAEDATTTGASSAADAEAADDADADAAGETAPTMATGGSSTDAAPTSDAGDDEGTTGTRTAAAPTTAVPTATGPTPQAPTPTTPAAPPTTTPPTTPPTTAPKPFAAVDLGIVGQATAAPPGMLSEFHVQLTNHGTGT